MQSGNHHRSRRHPNDETIPIDVDPPIFMQINYACTSQANKAYTEDNKHKHHSKGRCFNCSRIGHVANVCPMKETSTSQFRWPFQFQTNRGQNWQTTTCKYNQPFKKCTFSKPTKFGQPAQSYARTIYIEEMDGNYNDEEDVCTLAVRTNKLDDPCWVCAEWCFESLLSMCRVVFQVLVEYVLSGILSPCRVCFEWCSESLLSMFWVLF